MVRFIKYSKKKGEGLQLTFSPAKCLSLWIHRNPHLEDIFLIGFNRLAIDADYPAINKLKQLAICKFKEVHFNTSFLPYATGKKGITGLVKPKTRCWNPGLSSLEERNWLEESPCNCLKLMRR